MSKTQISVPVIKNGKDICRLIFTKADNGRYDLKIDFLGNAFQIQSYRLFSHRPIMWDVSGTQNSMSYHYGRDNNPVMIHIKKEQPEPGENRYTTLPITRIQPPNVNQMFPLPLLKMEVPDAIIDGAKNYQRKRKHKTIDLGDSNVLELYMLPDGLFEQNFMDKYPSVSFVYMMISMEFFASNTVLSDYQKRPNAIPHGEAAIRGIGITGLQGMELFASVFPDPRVNTGRQKLVMTFIENELTEPILLSGIIHYKKDGSGSFFGGANYNQVDFPAVLAHIGPVKDSVAERTLTFDRLSPKERTEIYQRAITGRMRLRDEIKQYNAEFKAEEESLSSAASAFMNCLHHLQNSCLNKHQPHSGEDGYHVTDEDIWLMTDYLHHSAEIHLLFAKYMGNEHCTMVRRSIKSKAYTPLPPHEKEYDAQGYEIMVFRSCSIHEMIFQHTWLAYNDRFDVDLLRGSLNLFLGEDEKEPAYSVTRALLTSNNDNWAGMKDTLLKHGFICSPVQVLEMDLNAIDEQMTANNGLLERIYRRIIETLDSERAE